jgi:hypothetical protein
MNASQLTQLRQKQANRFIGQQTGQDSSLQTYKVQMRASSVQNPSTVEGQGNNQGTNVMSFANSHEQIPGCTGVTQSYAGKGTNGEYLNVLSKAASCAVCSDPDYSRYTSLGVTLPCCPYETRQRYYITNSSGVIVDMNTYLTGLDSCVPNLTSGGAYVRAIPDCTSATVAIYGGGGIATTTKNPTIFRYKFSSG